MKNYISIYFNRFFLVFFICLIVPSLSNADSKIVIASGKSEPFLNATHTGFYDLLLAEMFKRIGLTAKAELLPSERSLINANTGINDGNVARIKGLEKKYKNLIRVPEKMIDYEFVAFTKNKKLKINGWDSLENYNIAYITGWKIFEKKAIKYKSLVKTQNVQQLFELINKNRVDIGLYDRWSGVWQAKRFSENIHFLQPTLASREMYLYMHKKHKNIIEKLAESLKSIKIDGTYQRIFDKTLNNKIY